MRAPRSKIIAAQQNISNGLRTFSDDTSSALDATKAKIEAEVDDVKSPLKQDLVAAVSAEHFGC